MSHIKSWRMILGLLVFSIVVSACSEVEFVADDEETPIEEGSTVFKLFAIQEEPEEALNIVFVPDTSYGDITDLANRQAFFDDLTEVVVEGYWHNQVLARNWYLTNFYYMTASGSAAAPTAAGQICPDVTWPAEASTDAAFADLVLLLHPNSLRDCRWGRLATSEPTSFRTVVHESSHALFNLPDEYCCDGGYRDMPPVLYSTKSACESDPVSAAWRDCVSITASNGQTWWRSEDSHPDIMSVGGSVVAEYGPADWVIVQQVLSSIGNETSPDVFAPDAWDLP